MNAGMLWRRTVSMLACLFSLQILGFGQSTVLVPATDGPRQTCAGASCSGPLSSPATPGPVALPSALGPEPSPSRVPNVPERSAVSEASTPSTEFQDFVTTSVGRKLPIYGYSLFDHVPSTFAPVDRVPGTAYYVIDPGAEIRMRAWGQIDLDAKVVVDRGGQIYLPKIG